MSQKAEHLYIGGEELLRGFWSCAAAHSARLGLLLGTPTCSHRPKKRRRQDLSRQSKLDLSDSVASTRWLVQLQDLVEIAGGGFEHLK